MADGLTAEPLIDFHVSTHTEVGNLHPRQRPHVEGVRALFVDPYSIVTELYLAGAICANRNRSVFCLF